MSGGEVVVEGGEFRVFGEDTCDVVCIRGGGGGEDEEDEESKGGKEGGG